MPVPSLAAFIGPALVALGLAALLAVLVHRNLHSRVAVKSPGNPVFSRHEGASVTDGLVPAGAVRLPADPAGVSYPPADASPDREPAPTLAGLRTEVDALRAEVDALGALLERGRPGRRRRWPSLTAASGSATTPPTFPIAPVAPGRTASFDPASAVDPVDQPSQVPAVVHLDDLMNVLPPLAGSPAATRPTYAATESDVEPVLTAPSRAPAPSGIGHGPTVEAPPAVAAEAPASSPVPHDVTPAPVGSVGSAGSAGSFVSVESGADPVLLTREGAASVIPAPLVLDLESHLPGAPAPELLPATDAGHTTRPVDAVEAADAWDALQPVSPAPEDWAVPVATLSADGDPEDSGDSAAQTPELTPSAAFADVPQPELRLYGEDPAEPADDTSPKPAVAADADAYSDGPARPVLSGWPVPPPVDPQPEQATEQTTEQTTAETATDTRTEAPVQQPVSPTTTHYSAMSRQLAAAGRHREAVLAQWAADLHVLAPLLGDRVPELSRALRRVTSSDPAAILGSARAAAVMMTEQKSLGDLLPLLDDLDHLTTPSPVTAAVALASPASTASTASTASVREAADPQVAPAERAALEAVLVRSAEAGGDDEHVSVALRWDLITHLAAGEDGQVSGSLLREALEPHERDDFDAQLAGRRAMTTVAPVWPWGLTVALCGTVGLLVGSFLNVVVHRVPAGLSVVSPPSACPACDHVVRPRDNVPVVSWLLLRGRCRDCAAPISWRYPLVEAATGLAFAGAAAWLDDPVVLAPALVVVAAGIALALIDLDHGRLPFAITGVATVLVLACLAVAAVLGAALPGPGTFAVSLTCWIGVYGGLWLLTAGRGMGLGDVALAPLLGLVLALVGVGASVAGLAAGFLIGMVVSGAVLLRHRSGDETPDGTRGRRVPHGPHMLAGAAVGLVVGDQLAAAYLRLVGLQ